MSVSLALISYFLSSYLRTLVGPAYVGWVFPLAYLITFGVIAAFPKIIARFGAVHSFLLILGLNIVSLLFLAFGGQNNFTVFMFVLFLSANAVVWVNYDVLLEMFSRDSQTGRIRTLGLTLMNLGWVITPVAAGFLIQHYGFPLIFILAAILLVPPFFIVLERVKDKRIRYKSNIPAVKLFKLIFHSQALRSVFAVSFLLSFFFCWMVIYTPMYLQGLGFDWPTIGKMFSVMLLPFVLFQFPAGYLADKRWGETEMLTAGFIIMALTTLALFYFKTPLVLALLLFGTRVGASLIEAMRDSYFYKHVSAQDVELIGAFRNMGPAAYIVGPLFATLVMHYYPISYLYPILACVMLLGLCFSLTMPDTK